MRGGRRAATGCWAIVVMLALPMTGCRTGTPAKPVASVPTDQNQLVELRWLPDGGRILVSGRWIFNPETDRFLSLTCSPPGIVAAATCDSVTHSFSSDGSRVVFADDWLAIARRDEHPGERIEIPRWVALRSAEGELVNIAFWLNLREILVQQSDRGERSHPECRVLQLATHRWRRPRGGCLEGGFENLVRIDPGPEGWIAIYSGGEGSNDVTVARYAEATGQSSGGAPNLSPEPGAAISAAFRADGSAVDVVSQCPLEKGNPSCFEAGDPVRWRLYSWPLRGGALRLLRTDLPPGSAPDPRGTRFAWPRGRSVCLGEPRDVSPHCVPLPLR